MIEVTYLNIAKQEKHASYENYNEFVRAQQACWIELPDSTPVTKVTLMVMILTLRDLTVNSIST